MKTNHKWLRISHTGIFILCLMLTLSACDFTVTNPGPVQDDFLGELAAQEGVVEGAGRMLAEGLNWVAYTSAAVSRELGPSGSIGNFGVSLRQQQGFIDAGEVNTHYNNSQRARWVSENAVVQTEQALEDASSNSLHARALLFAAYANRMMGENWCCAVIDGEAPQSGSAYISRALGYFDRAVSVATAANDQDLKLAALGGRASAKMWLGDWAGAVADANTVITEGGDTFKWDMPYFNIEQDQYNRIYFATSNDGPYRAATVWHTVNEEYAMTSGDPRIGFTTDTDEPFGDATVGGEQIPWLFQSKHNDRESPIRLTSSQEMMLILAENELVNGGNVAMALTYINQVRALAGMDPVTATTLDEGWTVLKRERGIELWLEGRRLGDRRRWEGTPGELDFWETHDWTEAPYTFDNSFPIAQSEIDTNPAGIVTSGRPF